MYKLDPYNLKRIIIIIKIPKNKMYYDKNKIYYELILY